MIDANTINEINLQNWKEFEWEMETKNRILRIANQERKVKEWNKYFKKEQSDDSYILNGIIY